MSFQACPDFKGIKTPFNTLALCAKAFQACPDFKGIKTMFQVGDLGLGAGFKLALISKGLRLCRWKLPEKPAFQACPDFKGIKTYKLTWKPWVTGVSSLP